MKTNQVGKDLIKSFETLRLTSYRCPAGVWTIGWGHTVGVKRGQHISEETAEILFETGLEWREHIVGGALRVPVTENQFSALVSLCFNIGIAAFLTSTVLRRINAGAPAEEIEEAWKRWNKITVGEKKVVSDGLVRRRAAEFDLWMTPGGEDK